MLKSFILLEFILISTTQLHKLKNLYLLQIFNNQIHSGIINFLHFFLARHVPFVFFLFKFFFHFIYFLQIIFKFFFFSYISVAFYQHNPLLWQSLFRADSLGEIRSVRLNKYQPLLFFQQIHFFQEKNFFTITLVSTH